MRKAVLVGAICCVVIQLSARVTLADHDMTCHPPDPLPPPPPGCTELTGWCGGYKFASPVYPEAVGSELNLISHGAGGATSTSCSSAGGDTLPVALPPDYFAAVEQIPGAGQPGRYWLFEPVSPAFLEGHSGLSADLPNFTTPDGTPLLAQYNETGLDFLLQSARDFERGESLSASGGQILAWPAVTLREMPVDFDLSELFPPGPARFPLYSGVAQVADVAIYTVVPEPASPLLLLLVAMAIPGRHRFVSRRLGAS
jgi:hypothetical protein